MLCVNALQLKDRPSDKAPRSVRRLTSGLTFLRTGRGSSDPNLDTGS